MRYGLFLTAVAVLFGCAEPAEHGQAESADHADDNHWTYDGDTGPQAWAAISADFATCGSGTEQSPIDLSGAVAADPAPIVFGYQRSVQQLVHNGHTEQATPAADNYVTIGNQQYKLLQYHMHTPSEHTIAGRSYPMEVHFVHVNDAGGLGVVGVLFEEGDSHPTLESLLADMPGVADPAVETAPLDPVGLLPSERSYFAYDGSLTTPPCSEGVAWHVFSNPLQASSALISSVQAAIGASNRPVQPIGQRELMLVD